MSPDSLVSETDVCKHVCMCVYVCVCVCVCVLSCWPQVLWIAPAYAVTLLVSFSWYNDIAQRAVTVRTRHNARLK